MNGIHAWSIKHQVSLIAVQELLDLMGVGFDSPCGDVEDGLSEAAVQSRVRLEAAKQGIVSWRNNVGALQDINGRLVRYGLCNDTKELNKKVKSGDLIGIKPIVITAAHIGHTIGQFWSRECKQGGWTYNAHDPHQVAQARWNNIVTSKGGDAAFTTGAI